MLLQMYLECCSRLPKMQNFVKSILTDRLFQIYIRVRSDKMVNCFLNVRAGPTTNNLMHKRCSINK